MEYGCIERAGQTRAKENCVQRLVLPERLPDPLGEDCADDPRRYLSDREIARVVFVAAETGHRFAREGREVDPAAWMFAPRRLFEGGAPVDACATRHGFVAAMVLHGVWPDLDAEPAVIEQLLDLDDGDTPAVAAPAFASLYTASLMSEVDDRMRRVFYATIAFDVDEARGRLCGRVGHLVADAAELRRGFDPSDPLVAALLPGGLRDLLARLNRPAPLMAADFEMLVDCRVMP